MGHVFPICWPKKVTLPLPVAGCRQLKHSASGLGDCHLPAYYGWSLHTLSGDLTHLAWFLPIPPCARAHSPGARELLGPVQYHCNLSLTFWGLRVGLPVLLLSPELTSTCMHYLWAWRLACSAYYRNANTRVYHSRSRWLFHHYHCHCLHYTGCPKAPKPIHLTSPEAFKSLGGKRISLSGLANSGA